MTVFSQFERDQAVTEYVRRILPTSGAHFAAELAAERDRALGGTGCPYRAGRIVTDVQLAQHEVAMENVALTEADEDRLDRVARS